MPLMPSAEVFITCAVTGAGDTTGRSARVPITPEEIGDAAIEAARAGAAIAHIHVRDPISGKGTRGVELYGGVVERIRASGVDVILNFTGGMGGDMMIGPPEAPLPPIAHLTDMVGASERVAHAEALLPEICTIDCGSLNFGDGDLVMVNTPSILVEMAQRLRSLGIRPEIEIFDTGNLRLAQWLVQQGVIDDPVLVQLCMGIPWGIPDDLNSFMALINNLPSNWIFSAFSIGRNQLPYSMLAMLAGGNIRVGLEDNLWLEKGLLATNRTLVERAVAIAQSINARILGPQEVREKLKLTRRW
ncbi:3-keto-5-aminohexanoate cleavage protein [Labrys okinawensis]|uniref:3-keto-5-aminohexanoate cleavage protein n=1 Tax=Labrys okinawensis TaxID=346911 RepID=UPI0039BCB1C7